ncbi:hypothetical protein DL764_000724 [Monosporascus ibericus]|uniref:RGS domain-containing protein n=1 Tax=Monosporascus ibericus TaxID=155417 RepID=A0A4Q4TTU1_9PEZI|nr:hypothetical protein DL764_000724 [Monosporascus ibericus]
MAAIPQTNITTSRGAATTRQPLRILTDAIDSTDNNNQPLEQQVEVSEEATIAGSRANSRANSVSNPQSPLSPAESTTRLNISRHQSTASTSSLPFSNRNQKSGGFLALAVAAFDKTIANISEPTIRARGSSSTPYRLSVAIDPSGTSSDNISQAKSVSNSLSAASTPTTLESLKLDRRQSSLASPKDPISRPYSEADPNSPPPIIIPYKDSKMHQTSSRLLRMTDDERPFTKSNRMPDPKDPSRIVTTTTTTTFSMAKDMARSICQRFLDARFIESADGKLQPTYTMKGSVWQLTAKGLTVLDRFCSRNGIQQRQIGDLVALGTCQLCILERDPMTDKLVMDRGTLEVVFRRLLGVNGLNIKSTVSAADSESLSEYRDGLTGVKIASERKIGGKTYKDTFTGKAVSDWLMDCCTTVERRETYEMGSLFVEYGMMEAVQQDRAYMATSSSAALFQPTKNAIYQLTAAGKDILNGGSRGRTSESEGLSASRSGVGVPRDSNTQRLDKILSDAALRLLFRENLRETHCEENLSFYLDVDEFVRSCRSAIRSAQKSPNVTSMDGIKEIMAQAYGIYNAFLAPGSPCELNIDHQLRNNLATRMTKAVGQDVAMIDTLHEVTALFEDAQNAVFKLMASDSVPKFLRNAKYESTLKHYDFDAIAAGNGRVPERSQSRSNRK